MNYFDESDILKLIKKQDAEVQTYVRNLINLVEKQIKKVSKTIKQSDSPSSLSQKLQQLSTLKLDQETLEALNNLTFLYEGRLEEVEQMLKQAGVKGVAFTETNKNFYNSIIDQDRLYIISTIDQTFSTFKKESIRLRVSNNLPELEEVIPLLGERLNGRIKTDVNTQLAGFQRAVHEKKAEEYDLNYFWYSGSLIKTSRPFCIARAGKVFKRSELKTWDNGQGLPVDIYLGGYNCRHQIIYIDKEMAINLGYNAD